MSKNQSIYNVFMNKNAVCAGFAKASQVIFQNIGINSYTITGESTGPHMWNVVELDGKYNFINTNGKLLYDTWFDYIEDEFIDGFARVMVGNKYNLISEYGKLVLPKFVDKIYEFYGNRHWHHQR